MRGEGNEMLGVVKRRFAQTRLSFLLGAVLFLAVQAVGQQVTNIACVYSVGTHLISNPLFSTNNDVTNLFQNPPPLLTIIKRPGTFESTTYDPDIPGWDWPLPISLVPGEGAWLVNPGPGNYTNVFVGEALLCSTNHIPNRYSIRSQSYLSSKLTNYSPAAFETLFFYKGNGYETYTFDPDLGAWSPSEPVITVGEAFWVYNPGPPRDWVICPEALP